MGNARSAYESGSNEFDDIWWTNGTKTKENSTRCVSATFSVNNHVTKENIEKNKSGQEPASSQQNSDKLGEFRAELERKHQQRRQIIADKRKEMEDLRNEVAMLRKENEELKQVKTDDNGMNCSASNHNSDLVERLRNENETLKTQLKEISEELASKNEICEKNRELRICIADMQTEVQNLNSEVLNFEKEKKDYEAHVVALKEVIKVSKQLLLIREGQLNELKQKVEDIEKSLAGKELKVLSQDLREEYERQLQNIRNLRSLYEERQRADKVEKDRLNSLLDGVKIELEQQQKINSEHEERIKELENENWSKYDEIKNLESTLGLAKAECRQYQAEMTAINQLFSEILLGFNNNQEIDLDKTIKILEENHDLLQDITVNEESKSVSSALPKVLLDLINRVNGNGSSKELDPLEPSDTDEPPPNNHKLETIVEESESQTSSLHQLNSPEEIVENLPKVWRVLIELLSHQCPPVNVLTDESGTEEHPCYKLVQTPKGPNQVLSVSQTFIRLKDLILEKKSLEKEVNHLKHLNTHLETRMQDQEKRLVMVSNELSKTWHVVGKLQKQHQKLHTQEQILRYELAQKRKLLNTLKEELEYSREKWLEAREKNSKTEKQWKLLRTEFASRKNHNKDELNNSVESGYSDERESSSSCEDEPGYETDISECNQKTLGGDENSEKKEADDNSNEAVLEEIETSNVETPELEVRDGSVLQCDQTANNCQIEQSCISTTENASHSDVEIIKTDSVQNRSNEKTDPTLTYDASDSVFSAANNEAKTPISEVTVAVGSTTSSESSSLSSSGSKQNISLDEVLATRDERLRRLENQAQNLVAKVANTSQRSVDISNKLDDLHEVYGQAESSSKQADNESLLKAATQGSKACLKDTQPSQTSLDLDPSEHEAGCSSRSLQEHLPTENDSSRKETRTLEEVLAAREERLKRMETQCNQLVDQVTNTSQRSVAICAKLDDLHEVFGESSSQSPETQTTSQCSGDPLDNNNSNENQE